MRLKLLQVKEATGQTLKSASLIAESMLEEAKADRECFWVLHIDVQLRVIEKELVAMGILGEARIHPREVFKKAIINSAASIITVHNHPSNRAEPSNEDKYLWGKLKQAGELLQIPVTDNLIITPSGKYYSEREAKANETHH